MPRASKLLFSFTVEHASANLSQINRAEPSGKNRLHFQTNFMYLSLDEELDPYPEYVVASPRMNVSTQSNIGTQSHRAPSISFLYLSITDKVATHQSCAQPSSIPKQ
jgi:hypothetical protein